MAGESDYSECGETDAEGGTMSEESLRKFMQEEVGFDFIDADQIAGIRKLLKERDDWKARAERAEAHIAVMEKERKEILKDFELTNLADSFNQTVELADQVIKLKEQLAAKDAAIVELRALNEKQARTIESYQLDEVRVTRLEEALRAISELTAGEWLFSIHAIAEKALAEPTSNPESHSPDSQ